MNPVCYNAITQSKHTTGINSSGTHGQANLVLLGNYSSGKLGLEGQSLF